MEHPIIEQIMKTGYPMGGEVVKVDFYGDAIEEGYIFFTFKNGDVVLAENLGEYVMETFDAKEDQA